MVVHENDGGRRKLQRAPHHFAGIDRRMVDSPRLLHLVGDQRVLLVEEQDADVFPSSCFCCDFNKL